MNTIILVEHVRDQDTDDEDIKTIGIYSDITLAEKAVEYLKTKPGFCEHTAGFIISQVQLDYTGWQDGFIT